MGSGVGIMSIRRLERHGSTIPVPSECFEAAGASIPWLDPTKTVRWLADIDALDLLHGNMNLQQVWKRFAAV